MAPKIARKIEWVSAFAVIAIFAVLLYRYYGEEMNTLVLRMKTLHETYQLEARYADRLAALDIPKATGAPARMVPVLVYHGIATGVPKNEEELPLALFEDQMFALKENGYQTITLPEFQAFIKGEKTVPEKSFVLTFDDGRKDSLYPADPILKTLGYSAVMFVITNTLEPSKLSPYYLSADELRAAAASGRWYLESHGRDDHNLITVDAEGNKGRFMSNKQWLGELGRLETEAEYRTRIYQDLVNAKQDLREIFGVESIAYAFPAGDYGHRSTNFAGAEKIIQAAMRETYPMSFFQANADARTGYYRGNFPSAESEAYLFRRIKVLGSYDADAVLGLLTAAEEKTLPYVEDGSKSEGWIRGWGDLSIEPDAPLVLSSTSSGNSAGAFLDGMPKHRNYRLVVDRAKLSSGDGYNLLARVKDGQNYLGCAFRNGAVQAFSVEADVTRPIATLPMPTLRLANENQVSIEVSENTLQCFLNDQMITRNTIRGNYPSGSVGLSVYASRHTETARLEARGVRVDPVGKEQ